MLKFKQIRFKNFMSTGNTFTRIDLDSTKTTLLSGKNGEGKCLDPATEIEIEFTSVEVENEFIAFLARSKL